MKMKILSLLLVALSAVLLGCERDAGKDENVLKITGTVAWKTLEAGFYAIDADDGSGYEPINLPKEFQKNGIRVYVTAIERKDMASINMYGKIIEILTIRRL